MPGQVIDVATTRGRVAVRVAGSGPAVLLVHGIPGSGAAWRAVEAQLVGSGFQVVTPDLLGFGGSARPGDVEDLWVDAQAAALSEVVRQLCPDGAIVVGHDYGAPISVTLTSLVSESVNGLVLAAGNLFTDTPIPLPLRAITLPHIGNAIARVALSGPSLRMMLRMGSGLPRPEIDPASYLGDARQRAAIRSIFATALRELPARYAAVERTLSRLPNRTVVIWGDKDPFFPLAIGERAAAAIRGAKLIVARGAGHFLPAERPHAFVDAIRLITRVVSKQD